MRVSREDRERYDIPHLDEIQREQLEREKEVEQQERAETQPIQTMA